MTMLPRRTGPSTFAACHCTVLSLQSLYMYLLITVRQGVYKHTRRCSLRTESLTEQTKDKASRDELVYISQSQSHDKTDNENRRLGQESCQGVRVNLMGVTSTSQGNRRTCSGKDRSSLVQTYHSLCHTNSVIKIHCIISYCLTSGRFIKLSHTHSFQYYFNRFKVLSGQPHKSKLQLSAADCQSLTTFKARLKLIDFNQAYINSDMPPTASASIRHQRKRCYSCPMGRSPFFSKQILQ